jgi:hypothetical protein
MPMRSLTTDRIRCLHPEVVFDRLHRNLAPHDLRRTCARLCQASGGELEQIQFLLGYRRGDVTSGGFLHDVPDRFYRHSVSLSSTYFVNAAEQLSSINPGRSKPLF